MLDCRAASSQSMHWSHIREERKREREREGEREGERESETERERERAGSCS